MKKRLEKALASQRWDASKRTQRITSEKNDATKSQKVKIGRIKEITYYKARDLFFDDKTEDGLSKAIMLLENDEQIKIDPLALNLLSLSYLAFDDYDKAMKINELSLHRTKIMMSAFYSNQCSIMLAKQNHSKAETAALKARDFYPHWHGPHCNLLAVYRRTDRFDEIENVVLEMVNLWPESVMDEELVKQLETDQDLRDCGKYSKKIKEIIEKFEKGEV